MPMDLRDSSSSPSTPNRNGTAAGNYDDDGVGLSVTSALAKDAALCFQSRKFAECVDILNKLNSKKENDPKVLHNIGIAEFFRDACSDPNKLLQVLNNVKKRSEELSHASREQVESGSDVGNKVISGSNSKGNDTTIPISDSDSANITYTDEIDTSLASLNMAVIWFHLHEYTKALSVLEPLYQNIEPIDETTALHICLLLLDVMLACQDTSKSADVLNYLEKAFGVGNLSQGENGNLSAQQSLNVVGKSSSDPNSLLASDVSCSYLGASVNASENPLSRTLSEDPLDMFSTLDIGGQNLARRADFISANDLPRITVDKSIPGVDLKLKLQLYNVQLLLLTRNVKLAKREVKHAMNIARGRGSSMALFLKAQLEYARGNHRKAIKLLMASSNLTDAAMSSMFNNNLGCIYYQLGKYHASAVFFSKALSNCSSLQKEKPLKLLAFSQDKSLLITYNCGLQYLACGKPLLAARCFQKASLVLYRRPLLWLRLAECCLMAVEKGLIKGSWAPSDRSEIRVSVIGKGRWRRLQIKNGISRNGHVDSVEKDVWTLGGDVKLKLSLPLARQCLYNALHLLNCSELSNSKSVLPSNLSLEENELSGASKNPNHNNLPGVDYKASTISASLINSNGDLKEPKGGTNQEGILNSISYYEDICRRENQMIKQALLANLAYVELELENPLKALSAARSLLELPGCSRIYVFLGHVYVAEALCLLNKPKEAAEHLSVYLSGESNVELPFGAEDYKQRRVEKPVDREEANGEAAVAKNLSQEGLQDFVFPRPEEARGMLYANLAVVSAIQGDLERAYHFVKQALSLVPNSSEATMTAIYVDLMLGKSQAAMSKLKHCSHVRFHSANPPVDRVDGFAFNPCVGHTIHSVAS